MEFEKVNGMNNEFNFYSMENNKVEEDAKIEENMGFEHKQNMEKVRVEDLFLNI